MYADFTAAELLTMGSKLNRRWDGGLARMRLAQLGIPPGRRVGKLSGGQRAQVALALALAKRPGCPADPGDCLTTPVTSRVGIGTRGRMTTALRRAR